MKKNKREWKKAVLINFNQLRVVAQNTSVTQHRQAFRQADRASECRSVTGINNSKQRETMSELVDRTNGQSTVKSNSTSNYTNNNSSRISGVVKFYSVQKCYGFIKRDDTKEYVFVHSKSVTGKNQRRVTRSLAKGERVEFDVVMSDRSPEAINVTGINDGPVLGSEYALITMQW